jgi:hypothetical protein
MDLDDLPELLDGPVAVAPPAGNLPGRLVHLPVILHAVPVWPAASASSGVNPQYPPADSEVVDLDATLDEQPSTSR